jgi:hypothetical protein
MEEDIFDTIFFVLEEHNKSDEWNKFYDNSMMGSFSYKFKRAFGRIPFSEHNSNYIRTLYEFSKTPEAPLELLETLKHLKLEDTSVSRKLLGMA